MKHQITKQITTKLASTKEYIILKYLTETTNSESIRAKLLLGFGWDRIKLKFKFIIIMTINVFTKVRKPGIRICLFEFLFLCAKLVWVVLLRLNTWYPFSFASFRLFVFIRCCIYFFRGRCCEINELFYCWFLFDQHNSNAKKTVLLISFFSKK